MVDVVRKGNYPVSGIERYVDPTLTRPSHIRVKATSEAIKRRMKHGVTRVGFGSDINNAVEWPFDQFTKRRILKGDVIVEEGSTGAGEVAAMFPNAKEMQEKVRARHAIHEAQKSQNERRHRPPKAEQ